MPVAIAAGVAAVLIVLAGAMAYKAASDTLWYAGQGTKQAADWAGGIAVVGGAVSTGLMWVAEQLYGWSSWAAAQLTGAIDNTVGWFAGAVVDCVTSTSNLVTQHMQWASSAINWVYQVRLPPLEAFQSWAGSAINAMWFQRIPALEAFASWATGPINTLWFQRVPALESAMSWASTWINLLHTQVLALQSTLVSMGGRVGTIERWIEIEKDQVLPRIQADINTRALERDLEALRDRVVANERAIAVLWTLAVLAAAGADVIDEVVRIGRDPCGVCVGLDLSDMEGRVAALEVNSG